MSPGRTPGALLAGLLAIAVQSGAQVSGGEPQAQVDSRPKLRRTLSPDFSSVGCEVQDKAGNIWFRTAADGLFRFDGRSFTQFTTKDGLTDNGVSAVIEDKAGNIVVGTGKGIWTFDGKKFTSRPEIGERKITCLLEDRDAGLWFGTMDEGVFRHANKSLTNFLNNEQFNLRDRYQLVLDILQDRKGNIWLATDGTGVWRYDGKTFKNFTTKDGLVNDSVFSVLEDRDGNLWFGTRGVGLSRHDGTSFATFSE